MQDWQEREARAAGIRYMLIGAALCLGGLALTIAGANSAASGTGGGRYIVFIGAVVGGFITFFRGVIVYSSALPDKPDSKTNQRPLPPYIQHQMGAALGHKPDVQGPERSKD